MKLLLSIKCSILVMVALILTSCASSQPHPDTQATIAADELRDTDMDVMFATEFPVANKAEAMAKATTAWEDGDVERALFYYVRALQFDPDDAVLLAGIGTIHRRQGNAELAARAFTMALHLDPDNYRALEGRGLLLMSTNEKERAIVDLKKAVEVNSEAWRANNALGMLADRSGDHAAARVYYNEALRVAPYSAVVLNNRGLSSYLDGKYDSAVVDLNYVTTTLDYKPAWMNLGKVYSKQKKYDLAARSYRNVLSEAESANKVAEFAMENGDYDIATGFLERAIRESPTYFPAAEENLVRSREQARRSKSR